MELYENLYRRARRGLGLLFCVRSLLKIWIGRSNPSVHTDRKTAPPVTSAKMELGRQGQVFLSACIVVPVYWTYILSHIHHIHILALSLSLSLSLFLFSNFPLRAPPHLATSHNGVGPLIPRGLLAAEVDLGREVVARVELHGHELAAGLGGDDDARHAVEDARGTHLAEQLHALADVAVAQAGVEGQSLRLLHRLLESFFALEHLLLCDALLFL
jgi:hypothetical protein